MVWWPLHSWNRLKRPEKEVNSLLIVWFSGGRRPLSSGSSPTRSSTWSSWCLSASTCWPWPSTTMDRLIIVCEGGVVSIRKVILRQSLCVLNKLTTTDALLTVWYVELCAGQPQPGLHLHLHHWVHLKGQQPTFATFVTCCLFVLISTSELVPLIFINISYTLILKL